MRIPVVVAAAVTGIASLASGALAANRTDIANNGSFSVFSGNTFDSGGEDTPIEIWNDIGWTGAPAVAPAGG